MLSLEILLVLALVALNGVLAMSELAIVSSRLGRLKAMRDSNDGFEIARLDLKVRGPGEFLGARQSGQALLRFADLDRDADRVEQARDVAQRMLRDHPAEASRHIERWMGVRAEYLKA